jgi:Zn-dependent oligopeptidase
MYPLSIEHLPSEPYRKEIYIAGHQSAADNLEVLDRLVATRNEIAQVLSFKSYAHLSTSSNVVEAPGTALSFLHTLSERLRGVADKEVALLTDEKRKETGESGKVELQAWDIPYYTNR